MTLNDDDDDDEGVVVRTLSQELCPIQVNGDTLECVDKFCILEI